MRILISTDIEGVAGIYHRVQTTPGNPEYERARLLMTREANAAIAGAFDGGARAVLVNDSHGDFRNMPPDLLDPRAQVVQGKPRPLGMMAGLDQDIDAVCLVGYHSRASGRGILAHTVNSFAFARLEINGLELGEAGLYGALAGEYGVPVVMGSGDDVFIAENHALFPQTRFVETKRATGQNSGISLSPAQAGAAIQKTVAAALRDRAAQPLRFDAPFEIRMWAQSPALADLFCVWPALRRGEGNEFAFTAARIEEAVRMINCLSAMSAALR
ncbi:M55 family metallopeptidase [Methylobacterium brachiatum]|jgi:D-amino peptidase|uniref:M55 family metallopeptidase n=1 Tax=Methylobacterium brachiatum TaxID=269660 RepID=UPI00244C54D8|nr:M55 family metallopeptidase [Methylobacterium brachiatum]MDH2310819.1 M55 family metallopeptidase [Methylobacterium brachiatum]